MNRRTFCQTAAALVTTLLSPLPAVAKYVKPETFLWVTTKHSEALKVYNAMGRPKNVTCIGMASSIMGQSFDCIIMDDACDWAAPRRWEAEAIRPRLNPGGRWVKVEFQGPIGYDWGEKSGIEATFREEGKEERRQGVRLRKRPEQITHDNEIMSRAKLLQWFIHYRRR